MSRPGHDDELSFILGPPAEPALRRYFDDFQAAFHEHREDEVRRYQALEKELLDEIFVGSGAEQASVFAELLGGALGAAVRLRRAAFSTAFMKGLWVPAVTIRSEDLEFLSGGPGVRFAPDAKTC